MVKNKARPNHLIDDSAFNDLNKNLMLNELKKGQVINHTIGD